MEQHGENGHRYGNFPNYYTFNPPENRIEVLKHSGILEYIVRGLGESKSREPCADGSVASCGAEKEVTDDGVEGANKSNDGFISRKKPRLDGVSTENQLGVPCAASDGAGGILYCDLGCNEGNLTMAMADLLSGPEKDISAEKSQDIHPSSKQFTVKCLGLDIDAKLIERANSKYCNSAKNSATETDIKDENNSPFPSRNIFATFKTANLCSDSEHNKVSLSFAESTHRANETTTSNDSKHPQDAQTITPHQVFDLTTIFSTTMWIHVHAGDDGLKAFLDRACGWTKKFLLVEPQPSGCYRKANMRLRKMGLPELEDITPARLKLRPAIEMEIEKCIINAGFQRVHLSPSSNLTTSGGTSDDNNNSEATTSWNRTLHLYERKVKAK